MRKTERAQTVKMLGFSVGIWVDLEGEVVLGIEYAKVAESTGRRWNPVEDGGSGGTLHVTSISFYVISP
jgi:hypothetical protein